MSFDGKKFGQDIVEAVKSYVDKEIDQACDDLTSVIKEYIDQRMAGNSKAAIKPRVRIPARRSRA